MKDTHNLSKIASLPLAIIAALLLSTCDLGTPDDPGRDNPLDIHNPDTHGDPYRLTAELSGGGVRLTWRVVHWQPLTGYSVYRKTDDSLFTRIQQVSATDTTTTDRNIRNGSRYEYYVVVRNIAGDGESSAVAKAVVRTDPALFIEGETVTETPTRNVTLTILAFGAERMLLSNSEDFASAVWEPFSPTKAWQLTTGAGTKRVYGRVMLASADTSVVLTDEIETSVLHPSLAIIPDSLYINHVDVRLLMTNVGASEMMVADNSFGTGSGWIPYQSGFVWNLSSGDGWKHIYGWFRNDWYPAIGPVVDSIALDTRAIISSLSWSATGGNPLITDDNIEFTLRTVEDVVGLETGGTASIVVEGWDTLSLKDSFDGTYTATCKITAETPKVQSVNPMALFIDRAGNAARAMNARDELMVGIDFAPLWERNVHMVSPVAFSPNGMLLASCGYDSIMLWNLSDGSLNRFLTNGHAFLNAVYSLAFSPIGLTLAAGSYDGRISLWQVSSGMFSSTLAGHSDVVNSLVFSPADGSLLASESYDSNIKLWQLPAGDEIHTFATGNLYDVNNVSFSPDGSLLASASNNTNITIWHVANWTEALSLIGNSTVYSIAFSPDGKLLVSNASDGTFTLWRVSDGTIVRTVAGYANSGCPLSFSPDGKLIAGNREMAIGIWRVQDGRLVCELSGYSGGVTSVAFSPDGLLLAGVGGGSVRLWQKL